VHGVGLGRVMLKWGLGKKERPLSTALRAVAKATVTPAFRERLWSLGGQDVLHEDKNIQRR
jgi:hypothetical protein